MFIITMSYSPETFDDSWKICKHEIHDENIGTSVSHIDQLRGWIGSCFIYLFLFNFDFILVR